MVGIGIDMATVSRIEKSMERPHFAERVFSEQERTLLFQKQGKAQYETAAANFAAKEAMGKAMGKGLSSFSLQELSVLRDEKGAPYFAYSGALKQMMQENCWKALVSLTHEGDTAAAFVVIEKEKL